MFSTILVPLDGSKAAESALEQATYLAKTHQSKIRLVQACSGPISADYPIESQLRQPVDERDRDLVVSYLESVQQRLQAEGLCVECEVLESGDPAHKILENVEQHPVDLIVLTSHGRSGISRFLMGSVAEKLARHAECPVLIVRRKT